MSDLGNQLNRLLGARHELDLTRLSGTAGLLLARLHADPDPIFLRTVLALPRTRKSVSAVAMIVHYMLRDALEARRLGLDELYLLFLATLFVLIIDDHMDTRLDPRRDPVHEVEAYAHALLRSCETGTLHHDDFIVEYITRLTSRLRAYPSFTVYGAIYQEALTAMLDGMLEEYRLRSPHATDFDHYMRYASHSVGTTMGLTVSLILLDDRQLHGQIDRLLVVFDIVAAIIRFSNDIRSYERELAEGKFSSLQLAAKKYGIELDQVNFNQHDILRIIRAMMIAEAYDLRDCIPYISSQGSVFEGVIINTVLGVVTLYEEADFDTLPLSQT